MKKLIVESFGDDAQGIRIRGSKSNPEPTHVRIMFPGGDVDVARVTNATTGKVEYWVHVGVNRSDHTGYDPEAPEGRVVNGRMDLVGKHASETDAGDLASPDLYHLAVRVAVVP